MRSSERIPYLIRVGERYAEKELLRHSRREEERFCRRGSRRRFAGSRGSIIRMPAAMRKRSRKLTRRTKYSQTPRRKSNTTRLAQSETSPSSQAAGREAPGQAVGGARTRTRRRAVRARDLTGAISSAISAAETARLGRIGISTSTARKTGAICRRASS